MERSNPRPSLGHHSSGAQSNKENSMPPSSFALSQSASQGQLSSLKRQGENTASDIFTRPPRKHQKTDPLVSIGRYFGRTVRMFCRIQPLIRDGLYRTMQLELERITEVELSHSELNEHRMYSKLLAMSPGLEERLCTGSDQDIFYAADMITKGASQARADDTKSLKSVIIDWITPPNGVLVPPLHRNAKTDRGFHHSRTGELLCPVNLSWDDPKIQRDLASGELVPSGDMWPRFLYRGSQYDPQNPWDGLLRGGLLVSAYRHVFTSPSSVGKDNASRATRSSNAQIHGMTAVTIPSIAYIATQVRFALSSSSTFSRADTVTDSEFFYNLVVELMEDPEEVVDVNDLLLWWNKQIFPTYANELRSIHKDSVIAKIKERRRERERQLLPVAGGDICGSATSTSDPPSNSESGGLSRPIDSLGLQGPSPSNAVGSAALQPST